MFRQNSYTKKLYSQYCSVLRFAAQNGQMNLRLGYTEYQGS